MIRILVLALLATALPASAADIPPRPGPFQSVKPCRQNLACADAAGVRKVARELRQQEKHEQRRQKRLARRKGKPGHGDRSATPTPQ
jgi:hypothetical protein